MAGLAYVHNLNELAAWTVGGTDAEPRFEWTWTDPDGGTQSAWQVKIYAAAAGGVPLYDSGKTAGADTTHDAPYGITLGTEYFWTLQVWDDYDESSGESTRTAFKVRWGQTILEYNAGASANWAFSSAAVPSNTQKAILFRGATGSAGAGAGPWRSGIGDVDTASYTYLNVLVRLATYASGTQPTFPEMRFTYTGSASSPDHWVTNDGTWALDASNYRYGSRSFKCTVGTNSEDPEIYPYRFVVGDDIPVLPNTDYTISGFVRTDDENFDAASLLRLAVYAGGSDVDPLAEGVANQTYGHGATNDSSPYPEHWQRLILRYTTSDGETLIRPKIQYINGGAGSGDVFWVDAIKIEPGTVASTWAPGWISEAVAIDSYGVMIDGSGGATFRLRSTDGTQEAELDDIVSVAVSGGGGGGAGGNLDGGHADTNYGGIVAIDGGPA